MQQLPPIAVVYNWVDIADPMLPELIQTVNLSARQVKVLDGIAYSTVSNVLHAIDLSTGDSLQQLTLPGSGTVTDLALDGTTLYAYTSGFRYLLGS